MLDALLARSLRRLAAQVPLLAGVVSASGTRTRRHRRDSRRGIRRVGSRAASRAWIASTAVARLRAARDVGLVGHDDQQIAGGLQARAPRARAGNSTSVDAAGRIRLAVAHDGAR